MIIDRMIAAASCGDRLFQRLGSDHHRIVIAESLVEGLLYQQSHEKKTFDILSQMRKFRQFLTKIDTYNDEILNLVSQKESE